MGRLSDTLKGINLSAEAQQLVAEADRLLDGQYKQAQYIEHLEGEVARLRKEKGISAARDNLAFNDRTGTYVDSAKKHHCTKCLAKDQRVPLKEERHGWRCMVCTAYYGDPDRPEGPINYPTSSWMA